MTSLLAFPVLECLFRDNFVRTVDPKESSHMALHSRLSVPYQEAPYQKYLSYNISSLIQSFLLQVLYFLHWLNWRIY